MPTPLSVISRPAPPALPAISWWGALLLLVLLMAAPAVAAETAGRVLFATGEAHLVRDDARQALAAETAILEGDRLETGAAGHVHLRMVDGALISLRADSALTVARYRYDPRRPEASEARLSLHHGVARTISGELGARTPERFRLNTPVAAIGIRGTDFSTLSLEATSRVSVRQGGILMAPLSPACRRQAQGPCEIAGARELFSRLPGAMLEARSGHDAVRLTYEGITPDQARPPHPREHGLITSREGAADAGQAALTRGASLPGAETYEEGLQQVERYLARPGLRQDAYALGEAAGEAIQPRDKGLVAAPKVVWGRWSEFDHGDAREPSRIARLIHQDRQYAGLNSVFGLLEDIPAERHLPSRGRAHFELNRYEAYVKQGSRLEVAGISHPGLVVDFEAQRFATRLDVHGASLPGPVRVVGGGELLDSGHLRSDADSPSLLEGVLTSGAGEAGLLFEFQVSDGMDVVGATHWVNGGD